MDSNAQYYPFDSFQPPIADSLIRDGECKNGHESCLFRIIELYHGRFTLRKLSRWKQWVSTWWHGWLIRIDNYMSVPFRAAFSRNNAPLCPLSLYTKIFFTLFSIDVYHRSKLSTPPPPDLSIRILGWNAFIYQTYDVLCNFIVRITQRVKMKRVGDLLNSN